MTSASYGISFQAKLAVLLYAVCSGFISPSIAQDVWMKCVSLIEEKLCEVYEVYGVYEMCEVYEVGCPTSFITSVSVLCVLGSSCAMHSSNLVVM